MNKIHSLIFFLVLLFTTGIGTSMLKAQNQITKPLRKGEVTYVSAKHVYLRFDSTKNLHIGDTVFIGSPEKLIPALVIVNKSSISTVCDLLPGRKVVKKQAVLARQTNTAAILMKDKSNIVRKEKQKTTTPSTSKKIAETEIKVKGKSTTDYRKRQRIRGRISAASYSSLYGDRMRNRLRYTFSLRGENIKQKPLSVDIYTSLRQPLYTKADSNSTRLKFKEMLRIYRLGMSYNTDKWSISGGRIMDRRVSNIGAIDGLLAGRRFGNWEAGGVIGLRPDYRDYSFNPGRLQFGGYIGYTKDRTSGRGYAQSILGVFEQRQHNRTDRRFLYLQHSGTLTPKINLYGSMEIDLFQRVKGVAQNTFNLTNVFVNVSYRISRKFSISTGYDNRRQILYYETYRDYIDSLLERETRQGMRLRVQYRPIRRLSISAMGNIRVGGDFSPISKYYNLYIGYSRIPWLKMRVSASAGYLENVYLNSLFYTFRASKSIWRRRLYLQMSYRASKGKYLSQELGLTRQNISGSLDWQMTNKLSSSFYYEYITSGKSSYRQVNLRITQRF